MLSDNFRDNFIQRDKLASWQVVSAFKAYNDEFPGGDRFCIELNNSGALCFYIADATGHGNYAAELWKCCRDEFDREWQHFLDTPFSQEVLYEFSQTINEILYKKKEECNTQLCIAIGSIRDNCLSFANFGYGTHLLVQQDLATWKSPAQEYSFGLKLGWINGNAWKNSPRSFVYNEIENVRRIILMTDCFLGNDFENPTQTLADIEDMNKHCTALDFEQVIPYFLNTFPCDGDDLSLIVVEAV
ncbi:SpoIIE family protein phosphatase [Candidatus Uabimicrobium sp. HlEnr_7]|uniref:SpoIIE family protein phosphatase n=1 Tax=Candidatus Uabimicrobium helgolandensis TaxID=3095367 RepID=UPI00355780A4